MKTVSPDYDCVIVGAGLVGIAQAIALQQSGLNVALLDTRQPSTATSSTDQRGLALSPSSQTFLRELGLWDDLASVVQPIREIHVSDQGHFGATRMNARDAGLEALGYVCPANRLLETLESALVNDVDISWQTNLEHIDLASDRVLLRVRDSAGEREFSTRLLVGADGLNSIVRESSGIESRTHDYGQSAIVANVTLSYAQQDTAYERFTRCGPMALLPLRNGRHVVVRCCENAQLEALLCASDADFLASLDDGFGHRFGLFSELSKRSAHSLSLSWAKRITGRRLALVGAAAVTIHPNGAQGLNLGLRDVAELARCVSIALKAGDDIGGERCLAEFATARHADHRAIVRFTDMMAQISSSSLAPISALRNLAMLGLDIIPPAKNWLIRQATGALVLTYRH